MLDAPAGVHYYPHANQVRKASRLQLLDNVGAMQFDGPKANGEMAGDNLVRLACCDQLIEERSSPAITSGAQRGPLISAGPSSVVGRHTPKRVSACDTDILRIGRRVLAVAAVFSGMGGDQEDDTGICDLAAAPLHLVSDASMTPYVFARIPSRLTISAISETGAGKRRQQDV